MSSVRNSLKKSAGKVSGVKASGGSLMPSHSVNSRTGGLYVSISGIHVSQTDSATSF